MQKFRLHRLRNTALGGKTYKQKMIFSEKKKLWFNPLKDTIKIEKIIKVDQLKMIFSANRNLENVHILVKKNRVRWTRGGKVSFSLNCKKMNMMNDN